MIEEAYHLAEVHEKHVGIARTAVELQSIVDSGRTALVLAVEGAEPIGSDVEVIDTLFRAGVRMSSLTWNRRTMMADGIGERDTGGRLTQLGVDAVARMEQVGMVLDISHLSESGFWHVAEIAKRPFVASHSSCRAIQDHPRNLTDAQIQAVAASGGFVALNAFGPFLHDKPTIQHYLDHIEHAVTLVGAAHVALGPDFIDDVAATVDPIFTGLLVDVSDLPTVPGLSRPADLAGLGDLLVHRLGETDAAQVAFETMMQFLLRGLPAGQPCPPIAAQ
jgi:membrane dipeptidase